MAGRKGDYSDLESLMTTGIFPHSHLCALQKWSEKEKLCRERQFSQLRYLVDILSEDRNSQSVTQITNQDMQKSIEGLTLTEASDGCSSLHVVLGFLVPFFMSCRCTLGVILVCSLGRQSWEGALMPHVFSISVLKY